MARIQNVPARVKEAPARALRAVFAGIGQALLLSDRMRRKLKGPDADDNAGPDAVRVSASRPTVVKSTAPVTVAPAAKGPTVTSATKPAANTANTANTAKPAAKLAAKPAAKPAAKAPAGKLAAKAETPTSHGTLSAVRPATQPPIPNYDQLSVASLRARLRGLDLAQVRQLLSYEKSRGSRSDVIAMYERRIAKLGEADG